MCGQGDQCHRNTNTQRNNRISQSEAHALFFTADLWQVIEGQQEQRDRNGFNHQLRQCQIRRAEDDEKQSD